MSFSVNIDEYYISNSNIECIGLQSFAPNWYKDIKFVRVTDKAYPLSYDLWNILIKYTFTYTVGFRICC